MIIVRLSGGLGNQMFQYALGRKLSIKNKDIFKLDLSAYEQETKNDTKRFFELDKLNIIENIANKAEIKTVKLPYGLVSKIIIIFRKKILRNFYIGYEPKILNKKGNLYLDGFWQNEKYFLDTADTIRQDFKLRQKISHASEIVLANIKNTPVSVSVHIRRGDYVYDKKTNLHHGTCSEEYYKKALTTLEDKIGKEESKSIRLFVFSDDIAWVEKNISFPYPTTFISNPTIANHEALFLMSNCHHHIIANSTFSWWGAWLDNKPQKIVIAPSQWNQINQKDYKDIIPNSWIKI